jgi:hypothetical protein
VNKICSAILCCLGLYGLSSRAQTLPASPGSKTIAVHAGHLFDAESGTLSGPVTVTIGDGRITAVTPGKSTIGDAELIELGNATLIPGLIGAHKPMDSPPHLVMNLYQEQLTIFDAEVAVGASATARKLLGTCTSTSLLAINKWRRFVQIKASPARPGTVRTVQRTEPRVDHLLVRGARGLTQALCIGHELP